MKVTNFRSAADMVAPLGIGQLDAGAGSASAGLYNATVQGINIKIVADKASSPPGYGATKILIRKDHIDSGRFKTPADLKGFRFAMNAPGVSNTATLNALLKSAGLRYSDVTTVNMPLPDHVAALGNKGVDASASVEPAADHRHPQRLCGAAQGRRRDHPEPPDRGADLFGEILQEQGRRRPLHARLSARRTLLQRRAVERPHGRARTPTR